SSRRARRETKSSRVTANTGGPPKSMPMRKRGQSRFMPSTGLQGVAEGVVLHHAIQHCVTFSRDYASCRAARLLLLAISPIYQARRPKQVFRFCETEALALHASNCCAREGRKKVGKISTGRRP